MRRSHKAGVEAGRVTKSKRPRVVKRSKLTKEDPEVSSTAVVVSAARAADEQAKSCWRCKRYKKKCNPGIVCDACITSSGFRVWPSTLGCRRGNLHTFAYAIVPGDVFDAVMELDSKSLNTRAPSWRATSRMYRTDLTIPSTGMSNDIWDKLLDSMKSSRIYGPGVLELIMIGQLHQNGQPKHDLALQQAAILLNIVLDLYHNLVSTEVSRSSPLTSEDVISQFLAIRKATIAFMDRFLLSCLTARINAWPATIIGCCLGVLGSVILADIIVSLPPELRSKGWPNLHHHILDLRAYLYSMARDLLTILARDAILLDMDCWKVSLETELGSAFLLANTPQHSERDTEGMRIVEGDIGSYDSMVRLKLWREQYSSYLEGDLWMTTRPLGVDLLIIMSLARLFVPDAHAKTLTFDSGVPETHAIRPIATASNHSSEDLQQRTP